MRLVFDERQLAHAPETELHNGAFVPHAESAERARGILGAIGATVPASDHGEAAIAAVHDAEYLDFLKCAWDEWQAAGRPGEAGAYAWPVVRRRPVHLSRIDARLGRYSFDAATPIGPGTWEGAYWSAQTALTGLDFLLEGDRKVFALCRPPGHHAGRDYLGGYCYLNNAAAAAEAARAAGRRPAILDIDYHHGNGTQDIFYARGDMPFVSIHADPCTDFPYYWGHADETGEGEGEGANLNLPLPRGTRVAAYEAALERALSWLDGHESDLLVLSFGADTWSGDPISAFAIETEDFARLGKRVASLGLPVLVVMEGGYGVEALGANVQSFLSGLA